MIPMKIIKSYPGIGGVIGVVAALIMKLFNIYSYLSVIVRD